MLYWKKTNALSKEGKYHDLGKGRDIARDEIEKIQLEKLKKTVPYIYERVAPYRQKMDRAGVKPEDIRNLDDLKNFRLLIKQILGITIRMVCLR